MTPLEKMRLIADISNRAKGSLTGLNCKKCLNRGYFHRVDDDGRRYIEECDCMVARRNAQRIIESGLSDMMERYTFDAWTPETGEQRTAVRMAKAYCEHPEGWFVAAGPPGTGKTHICTAICGKLMHENYPVRYVMWRDFAVKAKAEVNDTAEYSAMVEPLKKVRVLYLDDFFKTGKGQQPTTGDVNLAFEILNYRYNDSKLLTILSTEYPVERIMEVDEAVGSRIYERCKKYYLPFTGENWRTR